MIAAGAAIDPSNVAQTREGAVAKHILGLGGDRYSTEYKQKKELLICDRCAGW